MGLIGDVKDIKWKQIGTSDFQGAVISGFMWIRGPCGDHCISLDNGMQLGTWLLDNSKTTTEGEALEISNG